MASHALLMLVISAHLFFRISARDRGRRRDDTPLLALATSLVPFLCHTAEPEGARVELALTSAAGSRSSLHARAVCRGVSNRWAR